MYQIIFFHISYLGYHIFNLSVHLLLLFLFQIGHVMILLIHYLIFLDSQQLNQLTLAMIALDQSKHS